MLLAFSDRPMTIQEVAEATAVNVETQMFSTEERFTDAYDLVEVCSSLVSLRELPRGSTSEIWKEGLYRYGLVAPDIRVLQFAHMSVKEYVLSDRSQNLIPPSLAINAALSHSHITQMCLIYILDFNSGEAASEFKQEEFPFLAYSALHWMTHLERILDTEREVVEALLVRLFGPENENSLMNYLNLYAPNKRERKKEVALGRFMRNKQDFEPPIYYACIHGLLPVVKHLLSVDEKNKPSAEVLGSGLAAAASGGYVGIVELLLKEGADVNSPYCGAFWRPLHAAASSGNAAVVRKLLDEGALIDAQCGHSGSALNVAAEHGDPAVIQVLLDYGHDMYTWSEYKGPPLSSALLSENDEATAVLIQNGVDVNTPPDGYYNPMDLAGAHASIDTIRLLLDSGAEMSLKRPGSKALPNAAKRGDIPIIQLLLQRGANINGFSGGVYGTPLKAAIQSRDEAVFELMLRNGADINARGRSTKFPIDQAIFGGNLKAAEKLIELGAQFGDEALEAALGYDTKEYLAKMLIDRGANVNAEHER